MSADQGQAAETAEPPESPVPTRPALDVPPLAAWWFVAAGLLAAMLFFLTDHVLRATTALGATLVLAAVLRLSLSRDRAGGIIVRGRVVDAVTLLLLAALVVASGFTLDLSPR